MENSQPRLLAQNLSKQYGQKQVLSGVSFDCTDAGVYAILGQNGAGKTTLIKCALGLQKISSGKLHLFGQKPGSLAAKQRTGVILQDAELPDLLTVREHIQLFASYYPSPFSVERTIQLSDLAEFADQRYNKLSGGQKRRAQFALAIVGDPDLIFLDEPTTGLDIQARKNLWAVIRQFAAIGKTIILTTHYLEEADSLADRIMVLRQGRIVANDTPDGIHRLVNGSVIRCQSRLSQTQAAALPQVMRAEHCGRYLELHSRDANQTLLALLSNDPGLTELSVSQPRLEDIFGQLNEPNKVAS